MGTYLETLAKREIIAEQTQLAMLERDQRQLKAIQATAQTRDLFEDVFASSDPFQRGTSSVAGLGSAANDLFFPMAIGRHSARPGSRRDGAYPPFYYTEQHHWMMVDAARTLEAFCPTAVNILDVLEHFAIFTGFTYKIVEKNKPGELSPATPAEATATDGEAPGAGDGEPPKPQSNPLVDKAQDLLDRWIRDVDFHSWEKEIFHRSRRDGDVFLVTEEDEETEMMGLRAVEPEQVKQPAGVPEVNGKLGRSGRDSSWWFGILTSKEDTSKPLGYWVVSQFNDTHDRGQFYEPEEMFHVKINVDRQAKRGVSDFFSVANDIPRTRKLLRNLTESGSVQACVAWVVTSPEGTPVPDPIGAEAVTSRTGRSTAARTFDGPEVLSVPHGMEYTPGPLAGTGKSETLILVLQAALRSIGARWQMPEGIVSGDASNNNFASALVAEAPFVRAMESRQWFYRGVFIKIIERMLEMAAASGMLPEGENLLDKIEVSVEMPPVVPRNAKEETERNQILNERGVLSTQDWAAREDLDFDEQQAKIAEHPIEPMVIGLMGGEAEDDTAGEGASNQDPESKKV